MKHDTIGRIMEHLIDGKALQCACPLCTRKVEAIKAEQSRPARVVENVSPDFWVSAGERILKGRHRPINIPLMAAASLSIIILIFLVPWKGVNEIQRTELNEEEQERLLVEIETILSEPVFKEFEILLEEEISTREQSSINIKGGIYVS